MSRSSGSATSWRDTRAEKSPAVLLTAGAWLLALGIAFFLNRGDDAGAVASLIRRALGSMITSPVMGVPGLVATVSGLLIASLLVLAWFGMGDLAARICTRGRTGIEDNPAPLAVSSRCLFGAVLSSAVWMGLGVVHLYGEWTAVIALVTGIGLGGLAIRRVAPPRSAAPPMAVAGRFAVVLTSAVMTLSLIAALAPPTARDALFYHFALPKAYIIAGGGVVVPYNMATFYPQGVEMQVVWAMLLGRLVSLQAAEAAAGAVVFAFAPLLALITYGWAREQRVEPVWASIAALMVVSIPTVYDVAGSGYVDLALAAYTALAVHAVGRWWSTLDPRWMAPMAFGVAGTMSIKLIAGFLVLTLAVVVLVRAAMVTAAERVTRQRVLVSGAGALTLGGLIAAPWYLRTWIRTGSPVFPFYLNIWPGEAPGWDVERSRLYQSLLATYGDPRHVIDYILAPVRLAVSAQPDQTAHFDGVLGIAFLFALPVLVWALVRRELETELRIALMISSALCLFWLFSSQQIRLLLPALPGLAVVMAGSGMAAEHAAGRRWLRWLFVAAATATLPVILAWFATLDPLRVVLGGESRSAYLARRLDYYPYYELINDRLTPTDRVWLVNMRRDSYHIDRPYFSDFVFEDYTLAQYVREAHSADDVLARARAAGITHVLVRHDVLLDYEKSPIVDDERPREENVARLEILRRFLGEGTRLRGDRKFWLIELPRKVQAS